MILFTKLSFVPSYLTHVNVMWEEELVDPSIFRDDAPRLNDGLSDDSISFR